MRIISNFLNRFGKAMSRQFSFAASKDSAELVKKYPKNITPDELDKTLAYCQKMRSYGPSTFLKLIIEHRYPREINPLKLDKILKEAEVTRNRFSVY